MSDTDAIIDLWNGKRIRIVYVDTDPTNAVGARLLLPFTERAWGHPDAERIMRDGLAFLAEFCDGGRVEPADEPALLRSAARFLDRNYPAAVAA